VRLTLKFFYDGTKAAELEDKLVQYFEDHSQVRNKVHLSDTCHCEVACYNRLIGMDRMQSKSGISNMLFGDAGQILLQRLFPEDQVEYESEDIVSSHADIFEDHEHIIEIKWSAQRIFRAADISDSWRLQLMRYMSKHECDVGWMVIVNILSRQLTAFKLIMNEDERQAQLIQMIQIRDRILKAKEEGDPSELIIWDNECRYCGYRPSRNRKKQDLDEGCPLYVKPADRKG